MLCVFSERQQVLFCKFLCVSSLLHDIIIKKGWYTKYPTPKTSEN